jgi:hypothetical protein
MYESHLTIPSHFTYQINQLTQQSCRPRLIVPISISTRPTFVMWSVISIARAMTMVANSRRASPPSLLFNLFLTLIISTFITFFPAVENVLALNIPNVAYIIARYFASGVILATEFVHMLDPSYYEIGDSNTCILRTVSSIPDLLLLSC